MMPTVARALLTGRTFLVVFTMATVSFTTKVRLTMAGDEARYEAVAMMATDQATIHTGLAGTSITTSMVISSILATAELEEEVQDRGVEAPGSS